MNRFVASIAGIAFMTTASLAWADCISDCENNCLSLGDPGSIGLCIASCPATCAVPTPVCEPPTGLKTGVNRCADTAVVVTPSDTATQGKWTLSNDGTGGSAKAFMTLQCKAFPNTFKTVFKGSQTVNVGSSFSINCGNSFLTVSSTCGRANTCSDGAN
jgi:hypothetical protein